MPNIRVLNIYSNVLYVFHDKKTGINIGCTSLNLLAGKTGISYHRLRYRFNMQHDNKYEDENCILIRINTAMIFKGAQRIKSGPRPFGKQTGN